jgi:hypothetical protein
MDIPAGKPEPSVQDQVRQGRMFMLTASAKKKFHRCPCRPGRHIDDGDFIIYRREPRIAGNHYRAEHRERHGYPSLTSEALRERGLGWR